ncbi:glutamine amidotransferase [Alkalihalobacillus alcalophilus ATCC 27647 = CGMCC 1.3604]|uniref:Pyridoxal 5'-phosphate synthase subunit PdxT n=1 Tax=Alkalihalobacillus alcalophilus ATCC 27647 = CGMCC 1.3604 TaxID=1218173 RepID=A0A094WHC3_ALKAL|nr:pyridoxal 5'-phosphate synthase glutaminase subunit PdxT [Alkalihalobacillus alcalophilus]KGA96196.1 glutamine amidotransferase [Alkalihalobacillus alcalophilus ATCC 27647 = CGMCC 1.3604]MED1563019.1 pyridoxal 5'-phosphate synthase glutaminase subunit PdxT [Alkalihalobacillus alcalophilus]THG89454.1 glutamine amidotransferase [Alkalihalobacillus alcalophilus ATCC 27647 = CGMCC 1.3604]
MATIGVLSLQGAVSEHVRFLENNGALAKEIKRPEQLKEIDGLVLPGGESTTMRKLIDKYDFLEPLRAFGEAGKPVFGTCAGMILMAQSLVDKEEGHLGFIDMVVERNAFGRQRESFEVHLNVAGIAEDLQAVFIRAPLVKEVGRDVEVLSEYGGEIVAVKQGPFLACSYHPELTDDSRMHAFFIKMVEEKLATKTTLSR